MNPKETFFTMAARVYAARERLCFWDHDEANGDGRGLQKGTVGG